MTRPKRGRDQTPPPTVTAKALMDDLNLLYARIKQEEAAQDLALLREQRRQKRARRRAGAAPFPTKRGRA